MERLDVAFQNTVNTGLHPVAVFPFSVSATKAPI